MGHGRQGAHSAGEGQGGGQGGGGGTEGGGGRRDKGRQDSKEQEGRDKGRGLEEGIWGRRCTGGGEEAGGGGLSSHRYHRNPTRRACLCTPPLVMYPSALPPAPVLQHLQAVRAAWEVPGGKAEELRRARERVGADERKLREREVQVMHVAAGATGAGQGTLGVRKAKALEELQRARTDFGEGRRGWSRQRGDSEGQGERAQGGKERRDPPGCSC